MASKRLTGTLNATRTDPEVKIPAAVLAAAAASDAAFAEANPTPEVIPEPGAEVVPAAEVAPVIAPAAEPAITPVIAPVAATNDNDQSWKHKFESAEGRRKSAERLLATQGDRITGLETLIASMKVAPAAPASAPPSLITPEERTEYGADLLSVMQRAAADQVSPEVALLKNDIKNLTERLENVGGVIKKTAREQMQADLTTACPNWVELNENEKFLNWLDLPDTYSGAIRQALLTSAYDQNDTRRVLAFFNGFLAEEAAVAPQPIVEPALVTPAVAPKVPLAEFAAPGRAKTAAPSVPAEKPIFTNAYVTQFYTDVSARKYAGKDEEKNRIEAAIHLAGREGRIIQ